MMLTFFNQLATFYSSDLGLFIAQILILVLQSSRLATCSFSENELIAKFARVFMSLKLPVLQYLPVSQCTVAAHIDMSLLRVMSHV